MKHLMKKAVAIICAIALIVSSITIYNNTASAAVADLPESGAGVLIQVNDFGAGDILFLAGLDTIQGATSYNLYVDGTLWGPVTNGANLELTNFPSGAHTFCVTGVNGGVEVAKSKDVAVTIPNHGGVTTPEVVDGEELLKGTTFTDADTTTNESSSEVLWMELSQDNTAVYTNNGDGSVSVAVAAYEGGDNWATQLKQNKVQLVKDKWYVAKFTVTSDVDKKIQLLIQHNVNWTVFAEKIAAVTAGETVDVEVTFQATQTTDSVLFGIMMGYVDGTACDAANVTISNVSLKAYNANPNGGAEVTTPVETTTLDGETPVETSTEDQTDVTTEAPTTVPGVQNENTEAAGYVELSYEAFLLGDTGANQYKAACGKGLIGSIVNIQQGGNATEPGIYVAFKDANFGEVTVNGVPLACYIDGAGITMYLSNFTYMYSDVVVKNGDGTQKAVIYVYNAQGIDNSDKAIQQEPTTNDSTSQEITLQRLPATNTHQEFGSYKVAASPNREAYAGIDPSNRDHLQVKNASGPGTDSFTVTRAFKGLTAGVKYVLSVDITPSVANGTYKTLKDATYRDLQPGTTTVSMVSTAYTVNGVTQADYTLYVNNIGADVILDISNPQYRVATDEDLTTTQAPTTAAPTTQAPTTGGQEVTTQAPTTGGQDATTQAPTAGGQNTTVAPTTAKQDTTVAPTTKATVKATAPAKAKIKKVNSKKKAAKKVKLSLKKTKGAVGYQVAIYKTKKNAKKNKKALVKKVVTKRKVTITSKKLKNKKSLYVRARAYVLDANSKKLYGKWSNVKKVKIKK